MIEAVSGVNCGVVAPQKEQRKRPFILDETIPRTKSPDEIRKEHMKRQHEKMIADLKKKDPNELTTMEKQLLLIDKAMKEYPELFKPTVIYAA